MRNFTSSLLLAGALFGATALAAAGAKTYQVTGPIMDIQGNVVTVQKGKDLWQINMPAGTKGMEGIKKGDKITVTYTMTATSVEMKAAAPDKSAKKK